VLFDFDGTLTHPDALDFPALRAALGCPPGTLILEYIDALPSEEDRTRRRRILSEFEHEAARASVPNADAEETVLELRRRGILLGILTRNSRASIQTSLANFHRIGEADFQVIVTRESGGRPKPHPDGVLSAAQTMGVAPAQLVMVGDFVFDVAAGLAAGAATVLLTNGRDRPSGPTVPIVATPDYTIRGLPELVPIVQGA
jgi:HAD superfamily hydrolase (TIGR01509 family)